jgi:hypothetical protein
MANTGEKRKHLQGVGVLGRQAVNRIIASIPAEEWAKLSPSERTKAIAAFQSVMDEGIRIGRESGQTEGYKQARNIYRKRRPPIEQIGRSEFNVMLEELQRMHNSGKWDDAKRVNDRISVLCDLLRGLADDAIRRRNKILGLEGL